MSVGISEPRFVQPGCFGSNKQEESMNIIEKLKSVIAEAQAELAKMEDMRDAKSEPFQSLWFNAKVRDPIDLVVGDARGGFSSLRTSHVNQLYVAEGYIDCPAPRSVASVRQGKGQIVADFLNLLADLHSCEGVVAVEIDEGQWSIDSDASGYEVDVNKWFDASVKLGSAFPVFATEKNCRAAIDKVGSDRIVRTMKNWHGVK